MARRTLVTALIALAGVALLAVAFVYFAQPASGLPTFLPGHEAGSAHHHVKHGIAALAVAMSAAVLVWFRTGAPRDVAAS